MLETVHMCFGHITTRLNDNRLNDRRLNIETVLVSVLNPGPLSELLTHHLRSLAASASFFSCSAQFDLKDFKFQPIPNHD